MASQTAVSLTEYISQLDALVREGRAAFEAANDDQQLEAARVTFLGARQGRLKAVQKLIGSVGAADKPQAGKKLNEAIAALEAAHANAKSRLESTSTGPAGGAPFDPSLPGHSTRIGRVHPITQTIAELKDIMGRLGFIVAEGPEVEDEWHNFEALNIPEDHPARDPLENFYLATAQAANDSPRLLRSQTSTVQIRVMEQASPPLRIISLGRVYRPDTADATHYPMFHQIEGLWIDRNVSLADLKTVLRLFATSYLGADVPVRIRPSFFPFTEPSVEADYYWNDKWTEFGGAGIVDPHVLQSVGYDPDQWSGFAFGLGIERLCMVRHHITDIRYLFTNDVRFLRQF